MRLATPLIAELVQSAAETCAHPHARPQTQTDRIFKKRAETIGCCGSPEHCGFRVGPQLVPRLARQLMCPQAVEPTMPLREGVYAVKVNLRGVPVDFRKERFGHHLAVCSYLRNLKEELLDFRAKGEAVRSVEII